MPKICMLTTSEIFHDTRILNEAETLAKNYEVSVLARQYPKQKVIKLPYRIKLVRYFRLPFFQLNIISSFLSLIRAAWRENPDIYHAHDLDGLLCAYPAALIKRKILIYDSHELWSDTYPFANLRGIQWLLPILEGLIIWKVKAGITVNESIAHYLSKKYGKKFIAIYNTIKLDRQNKSPINLKKKFPGKKIILHLGAADEGRGLEEMIEAAEYFEDKMILVFLGGGKTEKQAQELVKKYRLEDKVKFLPAVLPSEIISTIKPADIGLTLTQKVSLSYYYSLPNKIFQYLAAKIPILGSNFPEFRKIILKNKIGKLVDPSKPKLIAQKIIMMTKTRAQEQYRQRLERLAKTKYNWQVEGKKLLAFYEKL